MTVAVQNNTVTYTGNGVATNFAANFSAMDDGDVEVYVYEIATGDLELISGADYNINGVPGDTFSIDYPLVGDPLENTHKIVILRAVDLLQPSSFSNAAGFDPATLTLRLDEIVRMIQQVNEKTERSVKVTLGSGEDPDARLEDLDDAVAASAASATAAATAEANAETAEANAETAQAATEAARDTTLAAIAALGGPMVFQGTWDASAGTFPGTVNRKKGWAYVVSVAGTVGGQAFEVNDTLVALVDNASTTVYAANWYRIEADLVQSVAGLQGAILAGPLRNALSIGEEVIPLGNTDVEIQAAIDSVSAGQSVCIVLPRRAYTLNNTVSNNGRVVSWKIDQGATFSGAGNLPAISSLNYGGHTLKDGVQAFYTHGSQAVPETRGGSPLVVQAAVDNPAVAVAGISAAAYKMSSTSGARARAAFNEGVDPVGGTGTFVEGSRNHGVLNGGTRGSAYGVIGFAGQVSGLQYDYMVAFEADLKDDYQDAPDPGSFDQNSFSAGMVFSNSGTKKADAMLVANPFTSVPYRVGWYVGGAIDHSIIWNNADMVHGIALLEGSFSGSAFAMRTTDRLGIYSDTGSTLVSSYGHGQIQFPATQNASADPNTLDDYEEGTFTPAFSASGAVFSYATQTGYYTKNGNTVFVNAVVVLNTSGNTLAAATLSMTGLPFPARTTTPSAQKLNAQWANSTTSYININAQLPQGSSDMTFQGLTAAATSFTANLQSNALLHATNGSNIRVYGTYVTN